VLLATVNPSLETYGANVDQLKATIGGVVPFDQIENALKSKKYKLITASIAA
jgi:alanine-glyoxylate transaminase / serine-glyoxylate transaminase / serine-pyruvate transaminase